jgi:cysteine-rich repeat protein
MLADTGQFVVTVDDGGGAKEVRLYELPASPSLEPTKCTSGGSSICSTTDKDFKKLSPRILAKTGGALTSLGLSPGLSDDGSAVAFYGVDSFGPGIWLDVLKLGGNPSVLVDWQLINVAGLPDELGLGLKLQNFLTDARIGVNGERSPVFGRASVYYVTFIAQNPVTGKDALWQKKISVRAKVPLPPASTSEFEVTYFKLEKIAEVGETLSLADGGATPPLTALATHDPVNRFGDLVFWAQFGTDSAVIRAKQKTPLVVNIVTHGFKPFGDWEPFRQPYFDLAKTLDNIPTPGTRLDGRVRSYVSEWESADKFVDAFFSLLVGKIAGAASENAASELKPIKAALLFVLSKVLKKHAQNSAITSAKHAVEDAYNIRNDVTEEFLLSDATKSKAIVHLVGHSRGAAVNALVSKLLSDAGYKIDQYTALDGFSTDWPDDANLIADISIIDNATAERKVNYLVQKDLVEILLDCIEGTADPGVLSFCDAIRKVTAEKLDINEAVVSLFIDLGTRELLRENNNLKAPYRPGFDNKCMLFSGAATPTDGECFLEGVFGSHHLNITKPLYTESKTEIEDNYVGEHKDDPKTALSTALSSLAEGQGTGEKKLKALTSAAVVTEDFGDFTDGGFESLGAHLSEVQNVDKTPTGVPIVDLWAQIIAKPHEVLSSLWTISGDVQLVTEGGNTSVQLSQTANTALGQLLLLNAGAKFLEFDFSSISKGPGDELRVYFNGQLLTTFPLGSLANGRHSIPIDQISGQSGQMTFYIAGPEATPAVLRLDNLAIVGEGGPVCGNSILEAGEQCDDGNTASGDGCSSTCQVEDACPSDPDKTTPGICGCGIPDTDSDGDGTPNCNDQCPADSLKVAPGTCGCGVVDTDTDGDGTPDCTDQCPADASKTSPGLCGCGVADTDTDGDGTPNCNDQCPADPAKVTPGVCGCGIADTDSDGDGVPNCQDNCPAVANPSQADSDGDGIGDVCDTPEPVCGNNTVEGSEQCDDGNTTNTDSCKNNCTLNVCGDGVLHTGVEQCDDGNTASGDGCSASCQTETPSDTTAPSCVLTAILPGPPTQITVTTQDTGSGLALITPLIATNATVNIPPFTAGDKNPIVVIATKIDQSKKAQVMLEVKDVVGNTTTCDPVLTLLVRENGKPVTETLTEIPQAESQITVLNGSPGIKNLLVTVNGVAFRLNGLKDGEKRSVDVAAAMRTGNNNTITLTAWGKPGSQATIVIAE